MTSTGIRKRRSTNDKIRDTIDNLDDEYIQRARKALSDSSPITGNAGRPSTGGSTTPGPSTLDPAGGAMFGTLAYNPQIALIDDGRLDIQANQSGASKASSYMLVTAQGSPDDLDFIDGADKNGQILDFQGTITQIINIKHADIGSISNIVGTTTVTVTTTIPHNITTGEKGNILGTTNFNANFVVFTKTGASTFTYPLAGSAIAETSGVFQRGNILTPDGTTVVIDGTKFANAVPIVSMRFDPTVLGFGAWRLLAGTGTGGAGSQTPWIAPIDGAGFTLTDAGDISIKNIQTDGKQAVLNLERNDTTPNDNDVVGQVFFKGPDNLLNSINWAAIEAESDDVTNTTKQAQLKISAMHDNSLLPIIDYTGADATFKFSSGVDVVRPNTNGSKELGTSSFFWDDVFSETFTLRGSGGNTSTSARTIRADGLNMIFNMPSGDGFLHAIAGNIKSLLSDGELEIRTALEDGPTFRLRNDDQSPSNNETAATILFTGEDSALSEATYGSIDTQMDVVTAGAKQADMVFKAQQDNSLKTWMNFLGGQDKINMFSFLDINSNYIEFDDRTVPAAPSATERILFSDSTNNAHLSILTDTTTIDLESPKNSPFMKVNLATSFNIVTPTANAIIAYDTLEDSLTPNADFTFTAGHIRCNFTGRIMIIANTLTQVIQNNTDLTLTAQTTVNGSPVLNNVRVSILTASNITHRQGSPNIVDRRSVTTNDIISTRIGVSSNIPFDTTTIIGFAITALTIIRES